MASVARARQVAQPPSAPVRSSRRCGRPQRRHRRCGRRAATYHTIRVASIGPISSALSCTHWVVSMTRALTSCSSLKLCAKV